MHVMQISSLARKFRSLLHRWRGDRRGNLAIIFALTLVPIMGLVGAAVDYSRANAVRTSMQAAADSTALMLSKNAASISTNQLQTKANDYFKALLTRPEAGNLSIVAAYSHAPDSQVLVTASSSVNTTFMKIMGFPSLRVAVNSQVKWGNTKLRIALVLDTTGSMADAGKMAAMQTATKNLLTQLQGAAATNGDVYVSIIPFSKNVNVGPGNYNATWIDWTDWESEPPRVASDIRDNATSWEQIGPSSSCPFTNNSYGFVCAPNPTSTSTTGTIPSSGTYSGYICPSDDTGKKNSERIGIAYNGCYNSVQKTRTVATGSSASCGTRVNCSCSGSGSSKKCTQTYFEHAWRLAGTAAAPAHSTWNGCVTDRGTSTGPSNDYDRKATVPTTSTVATLFPAEQNSYCSPAVQQLSYDWLSMKTMVDNLYPLGATNQPIGLVWGWQSLVGGGPIVVPAKDALFKYTEVIVLMSDGLNTLNRWDGTGSSTNTEVDKRMWESTALGTCANIKAAGITIYTVHVNTDGDPKSTLLENCASSTNKFWMVTSAGALGTVFNQIGTELARLYIAK